VKSVWTCLSHLEQLLLTVITVVVVVVVKLMMISLMSNIITLQEKLRYTNVYWLVLMLTEVEIQFRLQNCFRN